MVTKSFVTIDSENVQIDENIAAEVEVIIDADNATNDVTQAAYNSQNIFSEDFEVVVKNDFVTMGPSLTPTAVPITSIPTIAPTITGAVALIELTSVVDEEISEDLLSNITQQIVSEYGVDEEDIEIGTVV